MTTKTTLVVMTGGLMFQIKSSAHDLRLRINATLKSPDEGFIEVVHQITVGGFDQEDTLLLRADRINVIGPELSSDDEAVIIPNDKARQGFEALATI